MSRNGFWADCLIFRYFQEGRIIDWRYTLLNRNRHTLFWVKEDLGLRVIRQAIIICFGKDAWKKYLLGFWLIPHHVYAFVQRVLLSVFSCLYYYRRMFCNAWFSCNGFFRYSIKCVLTGFSISVIVIRRMVDHRHNMLRKSAMSIMPILVSTMQRLINVQSRL